MTDARLKQLFNRAVTDSAFRDELFVNLRRVLLEHGVKEEIICTIEMRNPQTVQALAGVLEHLGKLTT